MSFLNGKIVEKLVVPVKCCTEQGTAFFVGVQQLLTARHVVREHFCNPKAPEPIYVNVGGEDVLCKAVELGSKTDVALLIIDEEKCNSQEFLKLLKDEYVEDLKLKIYGYPREVAMGMNLVEISVRNRLEISGWNDRTVIRDDILHLHRYDGLSGAPVVNRQGRVVGILTQQTNETLGYLSINKIHDRLDKMGLTYTDDWCNEDNTTFGQGRSCEISEETIASIHERYLPHLHQENKKLENKLRFFSDKKTIDERLKDADDLIVFLKNLKEKNKISAVFKKNNPSLNFPPKNADELVLFCVYSLNDKFKNILPWDEDLDLKTHVRKLHKEGTLDYIAGGHQTNICLVGKAGSGKTHSLCNFARHNQDLANVYLFLGTQFSAQESVISHIRNIVCEGIEFADFNSKMRERGRFAVIVIDAINEGLGCVYWNNQLGSLRKELEKHDHFRLIVSVRSPFEKELNDFTAKDSNWEIIPVEGFENKEEAIKRFFKEYEIPDKFKEKNLEAFKNPLFLKIFCETFHAMNPSERKKASKMIIYKKYVEKKNILVSNQVDEDLELNIANLYLEQLANYSINNLHFNTISRIDARKLAKQLCPREFWSNDLLNACLTNSLLLADRSKENGSAVMFEYENLGDYYKAEQLLKKNDTVDDLLKSLQRERQFFKQNKKTSSNKFENTVKALYDCLMESGIKVQQNSILQNDDNLKELFIGFLMDSDKPYDDIFDILCELDNSIEHDLKLFRQPKDLSLMEAKSIHEHLKSYETVGKRDLLWTTFVNSMFVSQGDSIIGTLPCESNPSLDIDDTERKQMIRLGWLLATAHPKYRALLIRKIRMLYNIHPSLILWQLDLFYDVNDPYVLQGLFCAIAGVLLSTRNSRLTASIAEYIYNHYYEKNENVPQDLIIRQWTLKIIEKAYSLDSTYNWWTKIKTPFTPLAFDEKNITLFENINQDYFGLQNGSRLMYNSIFGFSDFNRYIIGTNTRKSSCDFFIYDDIADTYVGDDLEREQVEIAYYIMNIYGWNDKLGFLDNEKYSENRFQNDMERIGKKFQWLAWYRMNARLMDTYKVSKSCHHYSNKADEEDLTQTPYPWNTSAVSLFDPTLDVNEYKSSPVNLLVTGTLNIVGAEKENWIDDSELVPEFRFCAKDKDDQLFIMLYGFDEVKQGKKEFAVISNSAFVKNSNVAKFKRWCKTQNFYGRWMPERTGSIDFLWSEYPWADSYKSSVEEEEWERPSNKCPCNVMVSYAAQLQEHWEGIAYEDQYLTTVYMPCREMMEQKGLYCSEVRGIIKSEIDDKIIAVNLNDEDGMSGLFIRKDVLDEFLSENGYTMFYYVLGEKTLRLGGLDLIRKDLSAAYQYNPDGDILTIQSIRVVE